MSQAVKAPKEPVRKPKVESYDLSHSDETLHLATDLAKFIKENKLTTNVQGKDYVNVEGWQYAGSRLGIVPIVDLARLFALAGGGAAVNTQDRLEVAASSGEVSAQSARDLGEAVGWLG